MSNVQSWPSTQAAVVPPEVVVVGRVFQVIALSVQAAVTRRSQVVVEVGAS
jgi:hypothetical protein